jgi:diaminopimelate decarboxylase
MKKKYITPMIVPIGQGPLNPLSHGHVPLCEKIDGVSVKEMINKFGSPLFIFSEATLRAKIRSANRAFKARYPKVQFAWSYKTNYLNSICKLFHQEGSIAEVVSGFEYEKARHNGVPGHQIIFNGPYKEKEMLELAIQEGAMIQVDNLDELFAIQKIVDRMGPEKKVGIALRIYLNTETHEVWSKFGFNGENGEVFRVFRQIKEMKNVYLRGLHAHIGTFVLEPLAYRKSMRLLVNLAKEAHLMGLGPIEYLNAGGGFASKAKLYGQYIPSEQLTPSFEDYAEAICDTIIEYWPKEYDLPQLYLETGRALVDEAGYLATSVVAVKRHSTQVNNNLSGVLGSYGKGVGKAYGKEFSGRGLGEQKLGVILDSGVHHLYTAQWYQPQFYLTQATLERLSPTKVYGCLCMNIDIISENAYLPNLTTGDVLVIHPVGAYNWTQSMQFITYRPAVVMVNLQGESLQIRAREHLKYIDQLEEVPASLKEIPKEVFK